MIPRFAGQAAGRTLMYGVALAFAASPAQAQAPANEKMAQISSGLDDFIRDELNIRNVGFTIDREVISMAVNVGQDGPEMLMGKVSLLASAAGAAAPWTRELQLSVYSGNAPLAFIRIPTAQITAYAEGRIDLTQYLDSWQFSGVDDVAGGEPEPNGFKLSVASLCGSDREFVRSVYHAIAEREPAEWELNAHVQRLQGGVLRGRIVSDLLLAKNNSGAGFMADAIQAIYGRQPTPGELASWPRSRRATIIADMLGSPEHVGRTRSCAGRWREEDSSQTTGRAGTSGSGRGMTEAEAEQATIAAYNKLTSLMAAGKGDTPEGQAAYQSYRKARENYEAVLAGKTVMPPDEPRTGSGTRIDVPDHIQPDQPGGGTADVTTTTPSGKTSGIRVVQATYGGNVGAARGNVTEHIANACNGKPSCTYTIDYRVIGDPVYGKAKDYRVTYVCPDGGMRSAHVGPEAGFRTNVSLECAGSAGGVSSSGAGTGNVATPPTRQTVTIEPAADTHVYAYSYLDWNRSNWGADSKLGAGWHPTGGEKRTFIRFDFSGVDLSGVKSAKLRLYHYHSAGTGQLQLGVFRVTQAWNEGRGLYKPASPALAGEVTWISQPGYDQRAIATFRPGSSAGKMIEIDITPLVRAWASGTPNHGLAIATLTRPTRAVPECGYGFSAREHPDRSQHPTLILQR